jgi:inorganic pyrophosphatase
MQDNSNYKSQQYKSQLYKSHPWHGISIGTAAPDIITAFIEIVPTDSVKYEIDKESGYLKIDRPQKYSNQCPMLYGFVPQTYCGTEVGNYCGGKVARENIIGDGDPLDICILTEKTITHGDIIVQAIPIGGLRLIDKNQADDKIIAVLKDDSVYGNIKDIADAPKELIDRLRHYFLNYKKSPDDNSLVVEVTHIYSAAEAKEVISISQLDYRKLVNSD